MTPRKGIWTRSPLTNAASPYGVTVMVLARLTQLHRPGGYPERVLPSGFFFSRPLHDYTLTHGCGSGRHF